MWPVSLFIRASTHPLNHETDHTWLVSKTGIFFDGHNNDDMFLFVVKDNTENHKKLMTICNTLFIYFKDT